MAHAEDAERAPSLIDAQRAAEIWKHLAVGAVGGLGADRQRVAQRHVDHGPAQSSAAPLFNERRAGHAIAKLEGVGSEVGAVGIGGRADPGAGVLIRIEIEDIGKDCERPKVNPAHCTKDRGSTTVTVPWFSF